MESFIFKASSRTCLICGSEKLKRYRAHAFDSTNNERVNIVLCKDCEFAWQFPQGRSEVQSIDFFESAYRDAGATQSIYFDHDMKCQIAKLELEFVENLQTTDRKIMDIGGGAGVFVLEAAKRKWDVTVVDPALNLSLIQGNQKIIPIKGTLENINAQEKFDVITLWDVIEHALDPLKLISGASRLLKEEGWLVIETGNFKSADRIEGDLKSWIYQLDHRWYFSPDSMVRLLKGMGYSEFKVSPKVFRPQWNGSADYAGPSMKQQLKSILLNPLCFPQNMKRLAGLVKAKSWSNAGLGIFTIAARKTKSIF